MKRAFHLSAAADRDLEGIYYYGITQFGITQAMHYGTLLDEAFRLLCDNAAVGRVYMHGDLTLRRFECGSHILFYKIQNDDILVVRILHKSTDIPRHL
jgi:toxin ParE1/3/4